MYNMTIRDTQNGMTLHFNTNNKSSLKSHIKLMTHLGFGQINQIMKDFYFVDESVEISIKVQ